MSPAKRRFTLDGKEEILCRTCEAWKPAKDFYNHSNDNRCMECARAWQREYNRRISAAAK